MPKIEFEDKSFLEITKSSNTGKLFLVIAAKHPLEDNSVLINSVEVDIKTLENIINELKTA